MCCSGGDEYSRTCKRCDIHIAPKNGHDHVSVLVDGCHSSACTWNETRLFKKVEHACSEFEFFRDAGDGELGTGVELRETHCVVRR